MVGTIDGWDTWGHLEALVGRPLDREALNARRFEHELSLLEAEGLRPGITEYLAASERLGLRRAIVSSSSRGWIDRHLRPARARGGWDAIVTADHDRARAKPNPTLYLEALDLLGVAAAEAVAFEDSPNGIRAAKAAGLFTVAVPNEITRDLGVDEADLVVDSLADLPPDELLARCGHEPLRALRGAARLRLATPARGRRRGDGRDIAPAGDPRRAAGARARWQCGRCGACGGGDAHRLRAGPQLDRR